jgi:hypothetical protein
LYILEVSSRHRLTAESKRLALPFPVQGWGSSTTELVDSGAHFPLSNPKALDPGSYDQGETGMVAFSVGEGLEEKIQ